MKPLPTLLVAASVALLAAPPGNAVEAQEVTIRSADGALLADTLHVPSGSPPAEGWPAVVFLHGIGGSRAQGLAIAEQMGLGGEEYVVLALDARGHGASEGSIGLAGPNDVADLRTVFGWLRDRADVADARIEAKRWFDRFLRGARDGVDTEPRVTIAAQGTARVTTADALPATKPLRGSTRTSATIEQTGKVVARFGPLTHAIEVFGAPTVTVGVTAKGGWSRLVAVLTAMTKNHTTVVAAGGLPVRQGRGTYAIRLNSQATYVPKGATLAVTPGDSTTAQSTADLLYLDLPMPPPSRLTVDRIAFALPTLARPVSG